MCYKIALIGCGYWGEKLRPYLKERFDVVRIFGRSVEPGGRFTNRLDDALADEVEAVVIATPIDTHFEIAKRALEAGKHVLCEKPLAQKALEVVELAGLAKRKKRVLMTEFTYTFSTGIEHAKGFIDTHGLGKLLAMEISLRSVGRFLKYNVYWLLATHALSVLDMFAPLDQLVFKKTDLIPGETGIITFDGKIKGQIFVSLNYPHRDSRIVFYGTDGTLKYSAIGYPTVSYIQYHKGAGVSSDKLICGGVDTSFDEKNNLRHAVSRFADTLDGKGFFRENLDRSLRVTSALEGIEKE